MAELVSFLDKYDKILFDMDGVVTGEQNYWDIAALVVLEMIRSNKYFGSEEIDTGFYEDNIKACRDEVFCKDKTIVLLKNYGVNSNWDLGYVVFQAAMILETQDFEKVYEYLKQQDTDAFSLYARVAKAFSEKMQISLNKVERLGQLWLSSVHCFQEWYLGDEIFIKLNSRPPLQSGKGGMAGREEPLLPKDKLIELFKLLKASGKTLGMGTGRPIFEIKNPFERWGFTEFFDENSSITYTDVDNAEKALDSGHEGLGLTKPHPYMFLKGALGKDFPDADILNGNYPKDKIARTLAVGDAGADLFCAKNAGIDFAAVLTGVSGKEARKFFQEENADYILDSVLDFIKA